MSDLPPGWEWATLEEVAVWGSGGTPRAGSADYYGGEIPWAVIGDLNDSVVDVTRNSITQQGLKASSAKLVPPGTILVAMYGSIGKLGIANRRISTNQAIAWAIPCDSLMDGMYLFWYLRSQRVMLNNSGKGATQKNIVRRFFDHGLSRFHLFRSNAASSPRLKATSPPCSLRP